MRTRGAGVDCGGVRASFGEELEGQSGAVVRLGREQGVATPVHEFV